MVMYTPDEFSRSFGGMTTHMEKRSDGTFRCVVYDLGPNVCAAGDGTNPIKAKNNVRKVRYGYALRFDFLRGELSEDRKQEISEWFRTLSVDQLEMLSDFVEAARA